MSTIFGMKHPATESAILVADRQGTTINQETGLPGGKLLTRKLWISKKKDFCLGHVGLMDERTYDFIQKFYEGEFDIEKITKTESFPELRKLNLKRMGRTVPDSKNTSAIILVTRFKSEPKLYTCFPLGAVNGREWTTIGSGAKKIKEYMEAVQVLYEANNYVSPERDPTMGEVIKVGLEAVRRAQSQDVYSHGLDMLVCTPKGIVDHYEELGDDFGRKLKKIQRQYK